MNSLLYVAIRLSPTKVLSLHNILQNNQPDYILSTKNIWMLKFSTSKVICDMNCDWQNIISISNNTKQALAAHFDSQIRVYGRW